MSSDIIHIVAQVIVLMVFKTSTSYFHNVSFQYLND
jgi:hypothetical protein